MGATSSERERDLLRNGSRIHRRPYLYIALLPVLTMALCPAFVCTRQILIEWFWPYQADGTGGSINGDFNDGLANFLAPAGLVYAIVFGSTYQFVLDKHHELSQAVAEEVSFLQAILKKTSHLHIPPSVCTSLFMLVRHASLLLLDNFTGGQVGYHNHQEYLKCLSAMQVRLLYPKNLLSLYHGIIFILAKIYTAEFK